MITLIFVAQYRFFDRWYFNSKVDEVRLNIHALQEELQARDINLDGLISELVDFKNLHDVHVGISIKDQTCLEDDVPIVIRGIDDEDNVFDVLIETEDETVDKILNTYTVGNEVFIEGYVDGSELYASLFEYFEPENDLIEEETLDLEEYIGDLTILKMGTKMKESTYIDLDLIETSLNEDLYAYEDEEDGEVIIGFVETLKIDNQVYTVYIEKVMDSLNYSARVIMPFYVILYILSIVLSLVITLKLSSHITSPINEIISSTEAIAKLDFSKRVKYNGEDELGALAGHINYLSSKLNDTMGSLIREIDDGQEKAKERSHFFSSVSHELKTPLSVSRGYIEFLIDGVRKDKSEDYLKILQKENEKMSDIVMSMLNLIKYEEEDNIIVVKQSILPLIHEAERHFDIILAEKDMKLDIKGDFTECYFDEKSLIKVLINLMSNAINYGVESTTVQVIGKIEKGRQLIGIVNQAKNHDEIDMDALFQKFYSTDKSRNRKTSGTGLGMSIVKTILEKCEMPYEAKLEGNLFVFEFGLDLDREDLKS